ncbi:MAG: hydrolase [Acidimicrobiales bacterium mtb01]|nr:amidohydrolase family protein [Actinomycetota bacterium]TEX45119.1 MAG: hydrolase [Acidimicrobiales bacterium mtb01]
MADQLIRNVVDPKGRTVDVHMASDRIAAVGADLAIDVSADVDVFDGDGWIVLPALAEPHAHLDKALTAHKVPNPKGDLMGAIEAWIGAAERGVFGLEEMTARAEAALTKLVASGVTLVRTHVNVGESDPELMHLRAIHAARRSLAHLVDVQIVALMHSPMSGAEGAGNRRTLAAALEYGVDLVGGCPHLEADGPGMIDVALTAAAEAGVGVDLHVDETLDANMLTLRDLAVAVIDRGFSAPVAASHCVSLSMQPIGVQREVAKRVAEAGIAVVPLPQTNLFLQGWDHHTAMPRGITPVDVLREAGVVVAAGGDNVQDPFNPVGRSDPLETAALLVMAAHQKPEVAYDMVSNDVRRVLGRPTVDIAAGSPADLVLVRSRSVREAIADAPADRRVYREGRLVSVTTSTRWIDQRP